MSTTYYQITLTSQELAALLRVCGSIGGSGPIRELTDELFEKAQTFGINPYELEEERRVVKTAMKLNNERLQTKYIQRVSAEIEKLLL